MPIDFVTLGAARAARRRASGEGREVLDALVEALLHPERPPGRIRVIKARYRGRRLVVVAEVEGAVKTYAFRV